MPVLKTNELRVSNAPNCESWVNGESVLANIDLDGIVPAIIAYRASSRIAGRVRAKYKYAISIFKDIIGIP